MNWGVICLFWIPPCPWLSSGVSLSLWLAVGWENRQGRGVWAPLCCVLAQVWPAWSSSWGWNALDVWGGKRPEKLKLSHVASTDIWENLSYKIDCKATALSPVFSFQETQRMFIWVLGLLKSSWEVKIWLWASRKLGILFFSSPGSDFCPFLF